MRHLVACLSVLSLAACATSDITAPLSSSASTSRVIGAAANGGAASAELQGKLPTPAWTTLSVTGSTVNLAWTPIASAIGYQVTFRSCAGEGTGGIPTAKLDGGSTSSYTATGVAAGTYGVMIRALADDRGPGNNDSEYSDCRTFTVAAPDVAAATTLTLQSDNATYGSAVSVVATLTAGGAAVTGQPVGLAIAGAALTSTTDANGKATFVVNGLDAGVHGATASFGGTPSLLASTASGTATVTPKALGLSSTGPAAYAYGQSIPEMQAEFSGLVGGDAIALPCAQVANPAHAGTYPVACTPSVAGSTKASNYTYGGNPVGAPVSIGAVVVTPAPLAIVVANQTYTWGQPQPTFTASVNGLLPWDCVTLTYQTVSSGTSVGTYPIGAQAAGCASGTLAGWTTSMADYAVTTQTGTLTILTHVSAGYLDATLAAIFNGANGSRSLPIMFSAAPANGGSIAGLTFNFTVTNGATVVASRSVSGFAWDGAKYLWSPGWDLKGTKAVSGQTYTLDVSFDDGSHLIGTVVVK